MNKIKQAAPQTTTKNSNLQDNNKHTHTTTNANQVPTA